MSINNSSECNTRFDDTYQLYKYNIGIDYHRMRNTDDKRHTKKEKCQLITVVNVILDLIKTYKLFKYNIGIDYHHIRNTDDKRHTKKEKCQLITVVNVILDLMTLTGYTSTI